MGYQQQSATYYDKTADENLWVKRFRSIIHRNSLLACLFHLSHSHRYVHEKYSYKSGIIFGLLLAACGGLLFFPAAMLKEYWAYLCIFFIIATGMCFLETAANPYVTALGDPKSAPRRLNLAQSFNGLGAFIAAMFLSKLILSGNHYTRHPAHFFPGGLGRLHSNRKQTPWNFLICC